MSAAESSGLGAPDPILFDLDGTLTASGPGILASARYALTQLGEPIPVREVLAGFIGPPLLDSFQRLCGLSEARARAAVAAYRENYVARGQFENSVYDGIPELLAQLRDADRTLAVATSKAEPYAVSILSHFELDGFFDAVVGTALDGLHTTKAEVIADALSRLGRPAAGAVMVGDRSHDVVGALARGIPCVGALWGYGSAAELIGAGAVTLAESPAALGTLLR